MSEYGRIHTDGSRSGGQPVVTTGLDRSIEQFFFEVGYVACFADAFIKNDVVPFELTDAIIERAWAIAPEAHEDGAEFDRYLAAAQTLRQPIQSDAIQADIHTDGSRSGGQPVTGILERLRTKYCCTTENCNCDEAADIIERLREALEAAPIINLWESKEDFRRRQDGWLKTKYRAALEQSK